MELRPYQKEAKEAIFEQWDSGVLKTLLVLPTGCGKTVVFAKVTDPARRRRDEAEVDGCRPLHQRVSHAHRHAHHLQDGRARDVRDAAEGLGHRPHHGPGHEPPQRHRA